ncbi:unnamed protein product [Meganyctiphanes norvegica]|uniref:Ion transport domain-containing protein n=1 Tax=Meganyctiphanes norvegica TaxID=48144 RepID=A0AAV2R9A8_MEGNR
MREYLNLNTMEAANAKTGGGQLQNEAASDLLNTVTSGLTDDIIANEIRKKLEKSGNKYDLDHLYSETKVKGTLLHHVAKKNLPKVAELLIQKGANPDSRDLSGDKYCPLHYAAEKGHPLIMKKLLEGGANPNATEGLHGRCSLHLLVENVNKWKPKDNNNNNPYNECLDILLDKEQVNLNILNKDRLTPIFLAAGKKWEYMTRKLIQKGADLHLVGKNNIKNIDRIEAELPGLLKSVNTSQNKSENYKYYFRDLKDSMNEKRIQNFKNIFNEMNISQVSSIIDSEEDQGMTLLQYTSENGLSEFVEVLLKHGADPVKYDKTNLYSPILYACEKGFSPVLEVFERHNKLEGGLLQVDGRGETVLHKVVKQEYKRNGADYKKCLEIILKYKIDVDAVDMFGNTPLHHAALQENQSLARLLITGGAHLGIKNELGIMAISNIKPSVLEDAFDNSIKIKRESDNERLEFRNMEVILNYRMFVPTNGNHQPETDCIKFLSSSHAHRHLLRHPIINTFLSLKWQKISKYYTFNLLSYITYLILLTAYILIFHGTVQQSDSSTTNTTIKISETADTLDTQTSFSDSLALKITLQSIITLITICIGVKEVIQLFLSWHSYITSFKNWLELSIVIMTFVLLFAPLSTDVLQSLSAWIVLFSWTIFILILGCHPSLAIYITMFRRVTHNFTKFIFLFSFMIIAFSFSFYLIFQMDDNFSTIHQTILKTIAMSTGELEYSDLPLTDFPITSHILFVLFIVFILMVIMNLINGLAVSDIHMIQLEAEIYSYKNRVELISYLESFLKTRLRDLPANLPSEKYEICTCDQRHNFSLEQSQIESTMSVVLADKIDVSERINKIENQLANMDKTIEKTDVSSHVNNVSDRITQIEDRLTNMDATIASLADILKSVHSHVANK